MSAGILEKDTMFSVKEVPWHRLGKVLNDAPSIEQAIKLAGLDWQVATKPLVTKEGLQDVPAQATYRTDDGSILGVVGPTYKPLQNSEAFNFFDPFLTSGEATLETAGSLFNGRRIWVLAKINREDSVIVPKSDDRVAKYVLLSNGHDGSIAVRIGFTPIRVVCNNTLTFAHDSENSKLIRIKHTGNITENLEKVREIMDTANATFEATADQYRYLAQTQINQKDLEKYIKVVFATKKQEEEALRKDGKLGSGKRVMDDIKFLFESGTGNDLPGVKGTYWAAYNAVTEFISHKRGKTEENRLNSLWFGPSASLNKKALKTATEMARIS